MTVTEKWHKFLYLRYLSGRRARQTMRESLASRREIISRRCQQWLRNDFLSLLQRAAPFHTLVWHI